jgi:hypothetical protein
MRYKLALLLSLAVVSLSCQSSHWGPLDSEAFEQGQEYKRAHLSECGESQFAYFRPPNSQTRVMLEFKRAFFATFSREGDRELSEADRLNGLEWRGACGFTCTSYRVNYAGQWSEWKNGTLFNVEFPKLDFMPVRKIKGGWQFGDDKSATLEPVPCDQLPKPSN